MNNLIANTDPTNEHKLTAAQVEENCSIRLQQIGKEITQRLAKADKQTELAQNHLIAVDRLLAEAEELCDGGGFNKFRELFCPQLGKSQAYALLAIAAGKKTLTEHRTEERERKQKTRARQKAATNSGTVPETSEPEPQGAPIGDDEVETTSIVPEQTPEPAKPRSAVKSKDESLAEFTAIIGRLLQKIDKQKPDRFEATGIPADKLAKLGKFLSDLATLKKTGASTPTVVYVPQGNGIVSADQSAENRKALYEARDAAHDRAA